MKSRLSSVSCWRWQSLVAALLGAFTTGFIYAFSVYSGALKHQFGLQQSDVDTIGTAGIMLSFISFLWGMVNDRWGPSRTMMLGGTFQSIGFVLQWAVASRRLPLLGGISPVAALSTIMLVVSTGSSLTTAACFATCVRNFPRQRGAIIGLAKGWVGLSSGAITMCYTGFVGVPDNSMRTVNFLLVLAAVNAVFSIVSAPFLRLGAGSPPSEKVPAVLTIAGADVRNSVMDTPKRERGGAGANADVADEEEEQEVERSWRRRLLSGYAIEAVVMVVVALAALVQGDVSQAVMLGFAVVICLCVVAVVPAILAPACPLHCVPQWWDSAGDADEDERGAAGRSGREVDDKSIAAGYDGSGDGPAVALLPNKQEQGSSVRLERDWSMSEMLRTADCWLLFVVAVAVLGGGLLFTTNLKQMCASAGFDGAGSRSVSLFSVAQAIGRVVSGLLTDVAMDRAARRQRAAACSPDTQASGQRLAAPWRALGGVRPFFLVGVALTQGAAQLIALAGTDRGSMPLFVFGVALAGFSFGWMYPLLVIIVSELFGRQHLGGNYMFFDGACGSTAALLIAKYLAQSVYQSHIPPGGGNVCHGHACFRDTHIVTAALCVVASLAAFALARRSLPLYRELWRKRV